MDIRLKVLAFNCHHIQGDRLFESQLNTHLLEQL